MIRRIVLILVISIAISPLAHAADWRVWGSVFDKDALMLYSASDLKRDGDNVRVWIEMLSGKDVASFDVNAHPEAMQRVIARIRAGYKPPFATRHKLDGQDMGQVVLAEEVADEKASPTLMRALYEIDCIADRSRILAFSAFNKGQETEKTTEPQGWEYIPPDTPSADLKNWVCTSAEPKKKK